MKPGLTQVISTAGMKPGFSFYIFSGVNSLIYVHGTEADSIIHNTVVGARMVLPCQYRSKETAGKTVIMIL